MTEGAPEPVSAQAQAGEIAPLDVVGSGLPGLEDGDFETAQLLLERARRKPGFSHEAEIAYTALLTRQEALRQKEIYRI